MRSDIRRGALTTSPVRARANTRGTGVNPYSPPTAQSASATPAEDDIAAAAPSVMARVGGGMVALAGGVALMTGVQTMIIVTIVGPLAAAPWLLMLLGGTEVGLGVMIFRARAWAAVGALGMSGVLVLATGAWLVVSLGHGLFSLFALSAPFFAITALVMAILSMGPCARSTAARRRLRAQGLNLGI
jgi:hypothetical protein